MNRLSILFIFCAALLIFKFSFATPSCLSLVHNSQAQAYASEITVVIGTDRADSRSKIVASELLKQLQQNSAFRINVIDLADLPASIFKSDYFGKKGPQFIKNFVNPIQRASGLIFIAPEYDGTVPGILSYFLNHMRAPLAKKQVALVGVSAGKWGARAALDAFKGTLTHRGARILGDLQINIENVDSKVSDGQLSDAESIARLAKSATEMARTLEADPNSQAYQQKTALLAEALVSQKVDLQLNNSNSVHGTLSGVYLNDNKTLAYVQFAGPTTLNNAGKIIPGQGTETHHAGYGMPVGNIIGFKSGWFKKANLDAKALAIGKNIKMDFESGVSLNGKIKNLTYDADGNLILMTFSDCSVKKGDKVLFDKAWGDFDMSVADQVENITSSQSGN